MTLFRIFDPRNHRLRCTPKVDISESVFSKCRALAVLGFAEGSIQSSLSNNGQVEKRMPDHKFLDQIPCVVTRVSTSIKIPSITKKNTQVCEVVLKETGAIGVLLNTGLLLFEGEEVIAEFCSILDQGYYFLQIGSRNLNLAKPNGGAKILNFPVRSTET